MNKRWLRAMFFLLTLGTSAWAQNAVGTAPAPSAPESNVEHAGSIPPQQATTGTAEDPRVAIDVNDPLLQPPPLPPGKPTLIGGMVNQIDPVRQTVQVKPFGGGSVRIYFDERTHIYRDGVETTMLGIKRGERAYVDTLDDNGHILAKSIRIGTQNRSGDAQGQVLTFRNALLEVRENLSSEAVAFQLSKDTAIQYQGQGVGRGDLLPGSLVRVQFSVEPNGHRTARQITVYAKPGSSFLFAGKVTYLDLSKGRLAVHNRTDNKVYEISFVPTAATDTLVVGSEVTVAAEFESKGYRAHQISVAETARQ